MTIDHGVTHAVQYVLPGLDMPVVPLLVNTFAPPLPRLARCRRARCRARTVAGPHRSARGDYQLRRAVALAPVPRLARTRRATTTTTSSTSWLRRPRPLAGVRAAAAGHRRARRAAARARLRRGVPRRLLGRRRCRAWAAQPRAGRHARRPGRQRRQRDPHAGSCSPPRAATRPARTLAYSAMPEWKTGMGVAVIDRPTEPA